MTIKELTVFNFIRRQIHGTGVPPTLREIAEHFGFRSHTAATYYLHRLEKAGMIRWGRNRKARGIALVPLKSPFKEVRS